MEPDNPPGGGAFLTDEIHATIFTPEAFSAETRLIGQTVEEFTRREVDPVADRLELHEEGLMRSLLKKAGDLGILGAAIPEGYGGSDLSKSTIALINEKFAVNPSFGVSAAVHSGVAQLPLLLFGTEAQKQKYLPRLASGDWIGAFAVSEAGSGSDALAAQTRARLSPDGTHYVLSGEKMWITNGGFADLFTVFANVEGKGFTAFLVEREFAGVTPGREEHKLGLHGSSTRRLLLESAEVPVANVLGEAGQGFRPALYTLNLGRLGIAAIALGVAKESLGLAARYALQRSQFGHPIAHYGLIQHKLGEMAARIFAFESMLYRTTGYLDARLAAVATDPTEAQLQYRSAAEEYAIECAILKFYGTEALGYAVDEALQIHGGFGYSEEFRIARLYRDARVFRIFEGTNEINRLTVANQIAHRSRQGRIRFDLRDGGELGGESDKHPGATDNFDMLTDALNAFNAVMRSTQGPVAALASDVAGRSQEELAVAVDMVADYYAVQSMWLRLKQGSMSEAATAASLCMASSAGANAIPRLIGSGTIAGSSASNRTSLLKTMQPSIEPILPRVVEFRRQTAAAVLEHGGYPW